MKRKIVNSLKDDLVFNTLSNQNVSDYVGIQFKQYIQ